MKNKIYLGLMALSLNAISQQNATNNQPPALLNGSGNNQFWSRGGNTGLGFNNTNNIFGTLWNSPIYTQTNGRTRTRLNGDLTTAIWGVNTNVSGYLGLSFNPGSPSFFDTNSPWSMLHLDGPNTAAFSTGWRSWMRTGIYMRENTDGMYVGLKPEGGANSNRSDAIINWSDDALGGGPDKLRFIFTESTNSGNGVGTNPRDGKSLAGYEFMRMQAMPFTSNSAGYPLGYVGIGPMFTNALPPQNRLHINAEDNVGTFIEVSNSSGTGQTGSDGLHFGYPATSPTYLTAQINQKENDNLIMLTNDGERMRLSHIGNISEPTMNPGGNVPNNITRVSISYNPANPVTRPLSLLHIGYNTGVISATLGSTDGWRPWMDVGTFTSNGTDHVYVGLKDEGGIASLNDRQDAVLCWGDNQVNSSLPPNNGPDNFRFIFTSTTASSGGGTSPAIDPNGLEGMRMTPTTATGVFTGIGGDPAFNLYSGGTQSPNNTLEVNSWGTTLTPGGSSGLRFTNLSTASPTLTNPGTGVLAVNSLGDVIYVPDNGSGASLGNLCSAPVQNPLTGHYEIPLAPYNFYYSGQQDFTSNVGIGIPCSQGIYAKLHVIQYKNNLNSIYNNNYASVTGRFDNYASNNITDAYGVIGSANSTGSALNVGVYGIANGSSGANYGVVSQGDLYTTGGANTIGGYVSGSDKNIKTDIAAMNSNLEIIGKLKPVSFKFDNSYAPQLTLNTHKNYGFIAQEIETVLPDIVTTSTVLATYESTGNIINPAKSLKSLNYDGLIPFAIGGIQELNVKQLQMQAQLDKAGLSDAQVKTNINSFNALAKIKTLNPVSYQFTNTNVPQLSFKPAADYGFVAQQFESVYPELVDTVNIPASYDSLGNVVNASKTLKTINYKAVSALLTRAVQEQQAVIDSLINKTSKQDSINNAVQQQLTNLAALIDGCCHSSQSRTLNSNQQDIELSDKDVIVLNQNVPNPFAEQTTITYNIPASVLKAQLLFYNSNGQLIQTLDIKTRGKGKVNVFASDLSSGLYHYSLVADGKVVDSKKMVRE